MALAEYRGYPIEAMIAKRTNHLLAITFALFACSGAISQAHPGQPGHTHFPDEVDEFDQRVAATSASAENHGLDLGGILVLTAFAGCLGFAFFQKEGGIWSDVTSDH